MSSDDTPLGYKLQIMKICRVCKSENDEGNKSCSKCGVSLEQILIEDPATGALKVEEKKDNVIWFLLSLYGNFGIVCLINWYELVPIEKWLGLLAICVLVSGGAFLQWSWKQEGPLSQKECIQKFFFGFLTLPLFIFAAVGGLVMIAARTLWLAIPVLLLLGYLGLKAGYYAIIIWFAKSVWNFV